MLELTLGLRDLADRLHERRSGCLKHRRRRLAGGRGTLAAVIDAGPLRRRPGFLHLSPPSPSPPDPVAAHNKHKAASVGNAALTGVGRGCERGLCPTAGRIPSKHGSCG